jgi:hypothetical protein
LEAINARNANNPPIANRMILVTCFKIPIAHPMNPPPATHRPYGIIELSIVDPISIVVGSKAYHVGSGHSENYVHGYTSGWSAGRDAYDRLHDDTT